MKKIFYVIAGMLILFAVPTACSDNSAIEEIDVVAEDDVDAEEYVCIDDSVCIVDSIELEPAAYMDMIMPTEERDVVGRYTIYSKGNKYGIYDTWTDSNVTPAEYDKLSYSGRRGREPEMFTYFNMKMGKETGELCIDETDNSSEIHVFAIFP